MAKAEHPTPRTLDDNASDLHASSQRLEAIEEYLAKLSRYEETMGNLQGESIQQFTNLESLPLSRDDYERVAGVLTVLRETSSHLQGTIDEDRASHKRALSETTDRLDALYHERQVLMRQQEDKSKGD